MKLQATITKLKVTILVTLSFFVIYGYSQNFNEYFRFHQTDKSVISTGVLQFNDSIIYGISTRADSNTNYSFIGYMFNQKKNNFETVINLPNQNKFRYIETLPPQKDFKGRLCNIVVIDSAGSNGEFIIYNPQTKELIDSIYKSPKKSGFSSFIQKPDSTFLLFGTSTEFDPNGDFYVVHVGKNGEFISDTTYGNTNLAERGYSITTTSDGGFAFTGSRRVTVSGQPYRSKIVVYKFDSLGALEWTNQYGGDFFNIPYSINSLNDSLLLIGGLNALKETTPDYFLERPFSILLDINGNKRWDYYFNVNDTFSDGTLSNQTIFRNKIYSVGNYYSLSSPVPANIDSIVSNPSFISKLDLNGNELFRRYIFNFNEIPSKHYLYSIEPTPNGGFLLGGTIEGKAPDPVGQFGWIVQTDSLGCVVPGCHLVGLPNPQGQIESNLLVYPNPSNNTHYTWLSFNLPKTEAVSIEILNLNGQKVKNQNFGFLPQGNHQIQMDLTLASGIYFIKLQTPTLNETVKWVVE